MMRYFYRALAVVAACFATPWALYHQNRVCSNGRPLTAQERSIAEQLGVADIDHTSVMVVAVVPNPLRWSFGLIARRGGRCISLVDGITLGHAIYVASSAADSIGLMAHELVHVAQYERAGSVWAFMVEYIQQCLICGYHDAPWEIEARSQSEQALVEF